MLVRWAPLNRTIMKYCIYFSIVCLLAACFSTKTSSDNVDQAYSIPEQGTFSYISYKDTFSLVVLSFIKNDTYCFTEGIPYALIIGHPINLKALPDTVSVLARCDNNTYLIGEKLKILPVENPEISSLHKITFIKDTVINIKTIRWAIGSEYQAMWGQVVQRHL